ncbi:hypothetical protein DTO271G3_1780 [Paecilomyces variotii]|nr:hypothetical protein DTO271G3_1780 [Paecilomyces variotii]
MQINQRLLASRLGQGWGLSEAEKYRSDLGPFVIPFPKDTTVMERPFGIILTGHRALDFQRVHIRIAAVQAGLTIDVKNGGIIISSKSPLTALQFGIMRFANKLEAFGYRMRSEEGMKLCPLYTPWGFRKDDWSHALKIQELIDRTATKGTEADTTTGADGKGISKKQQKGDADDIEELVNFSDWLEDWVLESDLMEDSYYEGTAGSDI